MVSNDFFSVFLCIFYALEIIKSYSFRVNQVFVVMKCVMSIEKLVLYGEGVTGPADIDYSRKQKKWNTKSRRARMLEKVKNKPERFVSNYQWMVNELGEQESQTKMKDGISKLFGDWTRSEAILFEKETGKRRSNDPKGINGD